MLQIFLKIWDFSKKRHAALGQALTFSFLKSAFGITQLYAITYAIYAIMGEKTVKESVIAISILMAICIVGNFATSRSVLVENFNCGLIIGIVFNDYFVNRLAFLAIDKIKAKND